MEILGLLTASIAQYFFYSSWTPAYVLCSLVMSCYVGKTFHWSVALCFLTTALLSIYTFSMPGNQYARFSKIDRIVISNLSLNAYLTMTLFMIVFLAFKRKHWLAFTKAIGVVCAVEIIFIGGQALCGVTPYLRAGFFNNASMAGCFVGFAYPFMRELIFIQLRNKYIGWASALAALIAVLLTDSSMALGTYCVTTFVLLLKYRWYKLALALFTIPVVGYLLQGSILFDSTGRRAIITMGLDWWWQYGSRWIGQGPGTSAVFLPFLQQHAQGPEYKHAIFLWFHSDWVQLLFEQGIVGLGVYLVGFLTAVRHALRTSYLIAPLFGVAFCALGNFPVHWPVHAFTCMGIILMCFHFGRKSNAKEYINSGRSIRPKTS